MPAAHATSQPPATRWLAEHALGFDYDMLPADARRIVRHCILDWYAVTLAACREPAVAALVDDALEEGAGGASPVIGHAAGVSQGAAALIQGTAAHWLDYDDVNLAITGHPTAVVYSALLPLALARGSTAREVMAAFAAGYETACRVGRWLGDVHYRHGYHATATAGAVAAAAACARLMRLSTAQTASALCLAGTQAAGLKALFGTMAKPLHAGLAARGLDAGQQGLEAAQGFAAVLSPAPDWPAATATPPGGLFLGGRLFKYHASCYGTHAVIECGRMLRERGARVQDIARITLHAHPGSENMCNIATPRTANEARFSLRMNAAFGLLGLDASAIDAYTPARLADPAIAELRDRMRVEFHDDLAMMESRMLIEHHDGSAMQARHDAGVPAGSIDDEASRLQAKFHALAAPVIGVGAAGRLRDAILDLDAAPGLHALAVTVPATGGAA
ncbi:MmgE/PrpD family protein [Bordetella pertussis]|uniref:MmgE/PrpD family protein n=1 Tax=Bordetella pertussis TaxID=520 RepID=UPI0005E156DC|nr:MmgE/PrpD family protein [Bordetella pertussis]CFW91566.1 catabolic enzyme [Bordetella pertussis]CPI04637.1 catabolic enzyme [Bordetella pertussis]